MKCEEADLIAYRDNRLDPEERVLVEGHLSQCAQCREVLQSVNEAVGILSQFYEQKKTQCLTAEELLKYQSGELTKEEKSKADEHLESCARCTEALNLIVDFSGSFREPIEGREHLPDLPREIGQRVAELRKSSLADRLSRSLEIMGKGFKGAPEKIRDWVDDLLSPKPSEAPAPAAHKNAAKTEEEGEQEEKEPEDKKAPSK